MLPAYERDIVATLANRLLEERRFMQIVTGPRQTGKTTAMRQALGKLETAGYRTVLARASEATSNQESWLRREWDEARSLARSGPTVLALDEIQMVSQWSGIVKELWDQDTDTDTDLKIILTGSSSLLLQKGLREALTGRFEVIPCYQWDFAETKAAFGFSLDDHLFFGGYPGAAPLVSDENRWLDYMANSIIGPSVLKDVVALDRITKPALMETLFNLGSSYSGQEISYRKLLGQLDDAGNTVTVARYLDLLRDAGLLAGLKKFSDKPLKTRSSSPRLCVFDTSLMVANYGRYRDFLLTDPDRRGHLVESAVGAYLLRRGIRERFDVNWWREGTKEVDFVVASGEAVTAIEVKSGRIKQLGGLDAFRAAFGNRKSIVVGSQTAPLEDFLLGRIVLF
jgi:hypothetical protein